MITSSEINVDNTQPGKFTVTTNIPWQSHIVSGKNESATDGSTYAAGIAVELKNYQESSKLFEIQPYDGNSTGFWGVLLNATAPKKSGAVLLSGVTTVDLSATVEVGAMVMPDTQHSGKFCAGGDRARVLAVIGTSAVILLDEAGGSTGSSVFLAEIVTPANGYGAAEAKKVVSVGGGLTALAGDVIPVEVWRMHE